MLKASLRSTAIGLAAAIIAAFAPEGTANAADPRPTWERTANADAAQVHAESPAEITVGAQLEALSDVTVGRAELIKGSKVNVVKVLLRQGRLTSVDVELADGQVARAPATTVRTHFRVISD
jgi:hypothetical protein